MNTNRIPAWRKLPLHWCLAILCMVSFTACARDCAPQVREGWVRLPPPGMAMEGMAMMAGFGRIENHCPAPVTIVSASSAAFADTSLHETKIVDGISRMRPVRELRIAPDAAAVLKPGGLHLMLMQPTAPLKAGSRIAVEFELQDGRKLLGEFELRKPGD
jgi:copper(I)-binding protein